MLNLFNPPIISTNALIADHIHDSDDQHIMRLNAPKVAQLAKPGQFIHIQCDPMLLMRRPISIMRANPCTGNVDILYKVIGQGTFSLSQKKIGDQLSILGPIGNGFCLNQTKRSILIGGGVGMPPVIFLSECLKKNNAEHAPVLFLGSEINFPFKLQPSQMLIKELPADLTASMPLVDDLMIPCRLASKSKSLPGVYSGFVTDLTRLYLTNLLPKIRKTFNLFACGPRPMLDETAKLAAQFDLDCQLCFEEHMACAVGGCAGCAIEIKRSESTMMKRVCVDGPVFNSKEVYF